MKNSKFNWGTGIAVVIIIFMIISVGTTLFLMNQDVDLVESDYYAKGIEHQKQIERMNRTNSMDESIKIDQASGFLRITFPETYKSENVNGTVRFYRPSDSKKDFALPLFPDTNAQQIIPTNILDKGYWKVKLSWKLGSAEYYKESSVIIN